MAPGPPNATAPPPSAAGCFARAGARARGPAASPSLDIRSAFAVAPQPLLKFAEAQIREALRRVGKLTRDDELDCGGCGYDSCREFAGALIQQKAERSMCVTYMRKLALKKANALIQKMPSAVVIINDAMRIIEFNAAFATMFAGNAAPAGAAPAAASLEGVMLSEVMPFANLFHAVLKSGEDILDRDLRYQKTILHAGDFHHRKALRGRRHPAGHHRAGGPQGRGDPQGAGGHPAQPARPRRQIACLLGESAAESEITLNSIIESFSPAKLEEPKHENDWRKLYRR